MTDTSLPAGYNEVVITTPRKAPAQKLGPYAVNVPACFVDIYPFEGGTYSIKRGALLVCNVTKPVNDAIAGSFQVVLEPGGPNGLNTPPSWTEIITPMSLVVIGMRRGAHAQVVMVGLALQISETENWMQDGGVQRSITIAGQDFGYFFALSSFMATWFLGLIQAPLTPQTASGVVTADPALGPALLCATPDKMAEAWLNVVMAGDKGVYSNSYVPFQNTKVSFTQALGTLFEPLSVLNSTSFAMYLISSDQSWADKFKAILPFPWYEFFVITAPPGFYAGQTDGFAFTSIGLGEQYKAGPTLIGRVNPTPTLTAQASATAPQFTGIKAALWNALPVFDLEDAKPRNAAVGFDQSSVLNFFTLNPTFMLTTNGISNTEVAPYLLNFAQAGDSASIERYGFRAANGTTNWLADPTGQIAEQTDQQQNAQLFADLMARFCATYEPTPLMARGTVTTFLRPDIMPGCVFRYSPFKNGPTWDFYIEGVAHDYTFGDQAGTTLTLSRGMPTAVYADQAANGMLYNVHVGNAERLDGTFQARLPAGSAPPLQPLVAGSQQQFFAKLAKAYVTPQQATTQ